MRKLKVLILLVAVISLHSCKKNTDSSSNSIIDDVTTSDGVATSDGVVDEYSDGTYCAEVTYFNSGSGRRSTYTLNVDVESHEITVIHWPNGGWLDDSHFSPQEIDDSGACSFTSDKGYKYDIQITGPECFSTNEANIRNDVREDKNALTCPSCGNDKDRYADVCRKCKDKIEHTCKRCGNYDTFMWSSDDLCSDCKREDEDKERQQRNESLN